MLYCGDYCPLICNLQCGSNGSNQAQTQITRSSNVNAHAVQRRRLMTTLSTKTRVITTRIPALTTPLRWDLPWPKALDIVYYYRYGTSWHENVTNNALSCSNSGISTPVAWCRWFPLLRKTNDASDVHGASGMRAMNLTAFSQTVCSKKRT